MIATAFVMTRHAQMRRKEMSISEDRIYEVLRDPALVYPSSHKHPHSDTRKVYQKGDICVVVDEEKRIVITVLWHQKEGR